MRKIKKDNIQKKNLLIGTLVASLIFSLCFFYFKEKFRFNFKENIFEEDYKKNTLLMFQNEKEGKKDDITKNNTNIKIEKVFKKEDILARSYVIYDLTNKKLIIGEKENEKVPLASITKLMTAYVALENCNDILKLELDRLLIASNNESSDYIADNCPNSTEFIKKMNEVAKKNDLNMSYVNPSGLDIDEDLEKEIEMTASNYGSAMSVVKLINLFYDKNPEILSHTTRSIFSGIKNTNDIVEKIPFLIGSKTGFTDMAGGNLVTIYEVTKEERFAIVVLGSTKEGRYKDTELLLNYYLK